MTDDNFRFRANVFNLYHTDGTSPGWKRGIFAAKISLASSRGIKYNCQINSKDLTRCEIKTDGVPRALLRRKRVKRHAADAFHDFFFFRLFLSKLPPYRHENKLAIYHFCCKCFAAVTYGDAANSRDEVINIVKYICDTFGQVYKR